MSLNSLFQNLGGEWKRELEKKEEDNEKGYRAMGGGTLEGSFFFGI